MGKIADLTVVQKTIIDTLHKEPQTIIDKEAGCSQSAVSKWTEAGVKSSRATTHRRLFGYSCHQRCLTGG